MKKHNSMKEQTSPADLDVAVLIIQLVCRECHVKADDLENKSRDMWFVWPRWMAIHLIAKYTAMSHGVIADLFDRERTAIVKALNRGVPNETETNPARKLQLVNLELKLLNIIRDPQRKLAA